MEQNHKHYSWGDSLINDKRKLSSTTVLFSKYTVQ